MKSKKLKSSLPILTAFVLVSLLTGFGWVSGQTVDIDEYDIQKFLDEIYSDEMLHDSSDISSQGSKGHSMDPGRKVLEVDKKQGRVGINTVTPEFTLSLEDDGSIIAKGTWDEGAILQTSGPGTRLIWYPRKSAFRAGYVDADQWDDANIGSDSIAMGYSANASGDHSIAIGPRANASGYLSLALGSRTNATGILATAMGRETIASGTISTALGWGTEASGNYSTAMGLKTVASNYTATAMGYYSTASGDRSTAIGYRATASGDYSIAMGSRIEAQGDYSFAIALNNQSGTIISQPNTMAIMGGNVGIDDPAPSSKLSVNGDTRISGNLYVDGTIYEEGGPPAPNAVDDYITYYQYYQSGQYAKFKFTAKQDFVMAWEKVQDDMIYFRSDLSDLFADKTNTDYGIWGPCGFLETTDELDNMPIGIHEKHFLAGHTYDTFITSWDCDYDGCSDDLVTAGTMTPANYIIIRVVVDGIPTDKTIRYSVDAGGGTVSTPVVFDLFNGLKELGITIKDGIVKIAKLVVDELRIRVKEEGDSVVGSAIFPAKAIEYRVENSLIEENSQVFITFKSNLGNRSWYLSEINPGEGFTIRLSNNTPKELGFNYWIVLVDGDYEESITESEFEPEIVPQIQPQIEPEPEPEPEEIEGCTDSEALNYNSEATIDDGSCEYPELEELETESEEGSGEIEEEPEEIIEE